mmetsp:Transcript_16916/g.35579  ORF Transcript_16916/g.35579 Transcript_16916/m.35579 type:complete len:216 (-) Transcript_16916:518-1165(-)
MRNFGYGTINHFHSRYSLSSSPMTVTIILLSFYEYLLVPRVRTARHTILVKEHEHPQKRQEHQKYHNPRRRRKRLEDGQSRLRKRFPIMMPRPAFIPMHDQINRIARNLEHGRNRTPLLGNGECAHAKIEISEGHGVKAQIELSIAEEFFRIGSKPPGRFRHVNPESAFQCRLPHEVDGGSIPLLIDRERSRGVVRALPSSAIARVSHLKYPFAQ